MTFFIQGGYRHTTGVNYREGTLAEIEELASQ